MVVTFLIIGLLLITACAPQAVPPSGLTEEAGNVDAVEQADEDLDSSELDSLDEELEDSSW
jgi:hypothetical protein